MFTRRRPLHPVRQMKEMIWPTMGWRRTRDYFRHRLFRGSTSTRKIAGGLAMGCAVSLTPFLGFHLVLSVFLSWAFRLNVVATLAGTVIANPWTFPLIFWADYSLGRYIFDALGAGDVVALPAVLTLDYLLQNPLRLFLPMSVGGVILAVLCWPLVYLVSYLPIRKMQQAYRYQRSRRVRKDGP